MKFLSTRGKSPTLFFSEAMQTGLAPDGGLYVPEKLPNFDPSTFSGRETFPQIAERVLEPFFQGDPLSRSLSEICKNAFDFSIPLKELKNSTSVLELFHGPTAAFKDVGARFLSECLIRSARNAPQRTILVATSGDTGGAVAAAFHRKPGIRVIILFPKGCVSARQEKQLTCWGDNISAFAVRGTFDDCQRLVKEALSNPKLVAQHGLSSANSINIGRLLPQMAYYAAASIWYRARHGTNAGFIVPSGNVGNSVGALWAMKMGFPIRELMMATNANRPIPDYFENGVWTPRASLSTLANAMDVGNPSNMERVFHLFPDVAALRKVASSISVSDEQIREEIREGEKDWGEIWCPHTATALYARKHQTAAHWVLVATAHPAKFETIVEPLIGHAVPIPPALSEILSRQSSFKEIDPNLNEFLVDDSS